MPIFKTSKITSSFLIGLFIFTGFLLISFSIIWFGTSKLLKGSSYYATYFVGSVEGISKGTPVKYLGVPVGSIYDVRIAPDDRMIELIIILEKKIHITDSLRVKIEFSGLTGGRFLQLFYTSDTSILNWYPKLSFQPPYPVIPSAPSGIETLEAGIRQTLDKLMEFDFGDVSVHTISFFKSARNFFQNEELISTIENLKETTYRLRLIVEKADTSNIISTLELSSLNLQRITQKLENFADSLNLELHRMNISKKIDSTYIKADSLVVFMRRIGKTAEISLLSLDELIQNLKTTNFLVQNLIREYFQNPDMLLFKKPPPKEE